MARKSPNGFGSIRKKTVNGKTYFEARYTDPLLHTQKSISALTESECRRKLRDVMAHITHGTYVTPTKLTVSIWLRQWLASRNSIEESTRNLYDQCIRLYIDPLLGRMALQDLRHIHCQEFVGNLTRKTNLSAKSVHNIIGVLSKALTAAVQSELIATNCAADLDLPRVVKKPPKTMDSADEAKFLGAIETSPYRNLFVFGLNTGARISEVLGLRWKNVNLKTGEVLIDGQLDRQRGDVLPRTLKSTKTHKSRTIIVPPFVVDVLRSVSVQQKAARLRAGETWNNPDGLVFTRADGTPIPHTTIANAFKRIATQIGKPELSFHSLRHTYVTDEIRIGTDIKTVSANAGHSTIAVTMDVYAAATDEMKLAAADRRQKEHERIKNDA